MNHGLLVIFVSFSGGGKSTIVRALKQKHPHWQFSVSATTRAAREDEKNGVHYTFISRNTFENMIKNQEFIEYEQVHEDFYGTPRKPLEDALKNDQIYILDIDVKGALRIMQNYPKQYISFFIDVPDMDVLETRLRERATESEAHIQKRLSRIPVERKEKEKFDYVIINDKLKVAVNEIEAIIIKKTRGNQMKKDFRFKGERPDDMFEAITVMAKRAHQINQKRSEDYPNPKMIDPDDTEEFDSDVDFDAMEKPASLAMKEYEKGEIKFEYENEEEIEENPETEE